MKATGAPSKEKAVEIAMKEFLRAKQREELSDLIGNYEEFNLTLEENWRGCELVPERGMSSGKDKQCQ
jgi:hypothetical protein